MQTEEASGPVNSKQQQNSLVTKTQSASAEIIDVPYSYRFLTTTVSHSEFTHSPYAEGTAVEGVQG